MPPTFALRKTLSRNIPDWMAAKDYTCAFESAKEFLSKEGATGWDDQGLASQISHINQTYWRDSLVDELVEQGTIKKRVEGLRKALERLGGKLYEIDYVIERFQRTNAYPAISSILDGLELDLVKTELGALLVFCEDFSKLRFKKAGSGSVRVSNACWLLWRVREQITGRPFKRNYKPALDAINEMTGGRDEAFAVSDANFVHVTLRGIDPKVRLGTIRSSLLVVGKSPPSPNLGGPLGNGPF